MMMIVYWRIAKFSGAEVGLTIGVVEFERMLDCSSE